MSSGYIVLDRAIFEHPLFQNEEFTRLQAWAWMIAEAAWKPTRVRRGSRFINLERGQLAHSERFLAERWMWSKSRVRRFLTRLKTEAAIDTKTDQETTHITICNYDIYQLGRTIDGTTAEPLSGPAADQQRTKEEEVKKERIKKEDLTGAVATATRPDVGKIFDEQFWVAYPRREGANPKAPARKAFITAVKSGADPDAIVSGALRYAADLSKSNKVGTSFVAQALTWLHQKRWEDYPDAVVTTADPPKPPDPRLPSHEELKRKYGAQNANDRDDPEKGKGLRPEGAGVRVKTRPEGQAEPADNQAGNGRMDGLGTLFQRASGLPAMGDEARGIGPPDREGERFGDDGADAMAGVVRH